MARTMSVLIVNRARRTSALSSGFKLFIVLTVLTAEKSNAHAECINRAAILEAPISSPRILGFCRTGEKAKPGGGVHMMGVHKLNAIPSSCSVQCANMASSCSDANRLPMKRRLRRDGRPTRRYMWSGSGSCLPGVVFSVSVSTCDHGIGARSPRMAAPQPTIVTFRTC